MRSAAAMVLLAFAAAVHADPYEADPDLAAQDADYAAGKRAVDAKDWTSAVERFKRAAVRHPENADVQNYIGYSYRNLKNYDAAFTYYKRAIELDQRHRGAHEYIGETYLLVGDVAGAERHLKALREICLLGCEEMKDLEQAIVKYRATR
jgi:Flp pilus assembly protein TadD